ncbi:peroxide stress protein YaaA [Butyrivibrio sp. MC2021]|uniref:peroxide stress protein YaaA n=1 Tax=Butyrivibrio sp. MC2021 TaxID=1408306 RepID=UPI00047EDEFF|nr:peroxide stress protein YaaA [Butyrivibrio sp. MC2021]
MKIILSPAKKMNIDTDTLECQGTPVYLKQTQKILSWMKKQTRSELQSLWCCNDKIAEENFRRIREMNLQNSLTPAILSYEGIAYQYMAPAVFEDSSFDYVQEHLRILSGFYGVLKPMDGVTPYRLEMQAKVEIDGFKDLYEFWGSKLYEEVVDDSRVIINLASKEYSKCIEKHLKPGDTYITVSFVEMSKGKLVTKGTYAKMARGEIVRYMAEKQIKDSENIKAFDRLGYSYREDLSSDTDYVFERTKWN